MQELRRRENASLDERVADPPAPRLQTLGPPPADTAGRQAWQAQALLLEQARAASLAGDQVALRTATAEPPEVFGSQEDRAAAHAWSVDRDAAEAPADDALRDAAASPGTHAGLSVAIIGGSITGPVLSLLFRQAGFDDIHVYEATPTATPQAGGVIGLDHVSLGVLDTIGIPQEEIVPFPSERVISIKIADRREAGRVQTLYPGRNTTWTLAHHALTRRLPEHALHTGARLVDLEPGPDGRPVLRFQGGSSATADLAAFADGRTSTGRRLLDPDRPLRYAGYVAHRGQLDDCPADLRDFRRYEPNGTQFTAFPIRHAGGVGTDWTFYLSASAEQFRAHFGADPTTRTFVAPHQISDAARAYVDAKATELLPPSAADLVHRTTTRMAVPVLDIAPPTRMVYPVGAGRAVLLGDALAPVRPHTGRGGNNGIDQAAGLVTALSQHRRYHADLDAALAAWQARYLPMVAQSLQLGPQLGHAIGLGDD